MSVVSWSSDGFPRSARGNVAVGKLRLTRRGRVVLIGVPLLIISAVLAVALLVFLSPSKVVASTELEQGVSEKVITVPSGDTLWDVAHSVDSDRDTRAVIAEIMELNDLDTQSVAAGQRLVIPAQ